jgi:hypothetical protein
LKAVEANTFSAGVVRDFDGVAVEGGYDGCYAPLKLWTGGLVSWMQNPTEIIENPSQQKTAEAQSTDSRASTPGYPLRSGDSKRAEFFAERMVYNVQQTVKTVSGAVQLTSKNQAGNQMQNRDLVDYTQSAF